MRLAGRAMILAGTIAALLPAPPGGSAAEEVRLPTGRDAVAIALGAETVFFGRRGVETILPGAVDDEELVEIELGLDGEPRSVVVTQRLVVGGLGDFQFKIPGPAMTVEALPESESPPGLRRGSVLWQGFSDGEKLLAARMPLFPEQERGRLPVDIDLSIAVDGRPVAPGEPASGELEIELRVRNISPMPISIAGGPVDEPAVAAALDAVYRTLRRGGRPVPGEDDLPESLPITGPPGGAEVRELDAPFLFEGTITFPPGSVEGLEATDGVRTEPSAATFEVLLGGGAPLAHEVRITGRVRDLGLPDIRFRGSPHPPLASTVRAPARSWAAAAASGETEGEEMLDALLVALWRTARLRQFDAYLGNPDPLGPARTSYEWTVSPPTPAAGPGAPSVAVAGPSPLGVAVLVLIALLLAFLLLVAWAHA